MILRLVMVAALLFGFTRPGLSLEVFACEPEWGALARELAGQETSIFTATTARQDPHHIEAKPSLIAKMRRADLLVCTGAGLEVGWLPMLLRQSANGKVQPGRPGHFIAADYVDKLEVRPNADRSEGDIHPEGNPHFHLDPRRILPIAEALAGRLAEIDPENANRYQERHQDFVKRWKEATVRWEAKAAPLRGVRAVSHHQDWVYLYDWLGMEEAARVEPKPGIPPSAGHLAALKARLEEKPARMVLRTPYQNERGSNWLAERVGVKPIVLPYTVGGAQGTDDLLKLMDVTIDRLLEGTR